MNYQERHFPKNSFIAKFLQGHLFAFYLQSWTFSSNWDPHCLSTLSLLRSLWTTHSLSSRVSSSSTFLNSQPHSLPGDPRWYLRVIMALSSVFPAWLHPGNSYWNNAFVLSSEMTNGGIKLTDGVGSLQMLKICKNIPGSLNGAFFSRPSQGSSGHQHMYSGWMEPSAPWATWGRRKDHTAGEFQILHFSLFSL